MDAIAGILLVLRTPRLWPLCFGPLVAAVAVYALLGIGGGLLLVPRLPVWLGLTRGGSGWWLIEALGAVALTVAWLFLFSFVFVLLAGVFAGLIFDRLSRSVETLTGGGNEIPDAAIGCGAQAADGAGRLVLSGLLGLVALLLTPALGPLPGVVVAALIGLLDFTAPAYLRRGKTIGTQARRLLGRPDGATIGFALVAGLLSLVPLVGVLLLPGLVAGGTLLAARRESAA